ncbi:MAG: hypothetical protein EOR22_23680 [Mesorhizobium sp.]|nr:MAG: hypothetical protein EOR22_23680 [Mesorhizobium sp.]
MTAPLAAFPPVLAELSPIWTILADLNPRQVEFIARYYGNGRNAADAARHAGYASDGPLAKNGGYALLHRRPKVAAAVRRIDRLLANRFQAAFIRSMAGDCRAAALAKTVMDEVYPLLPRDKQSSTVK